MPVRPVTLVAASVVVVSLLACGGASRAELDEARADLEACEGRQLPPLPYDVDIDAELETTRGDLAACQASK